MMDFPVVSENELKVWEATLSGKTATAHRIKRLFSTIRDLQRQVSEKDEIIADRTKDVVYLTERVEAQHNFHEVLNNDLIAASQELKDYKAALDSALFDIENGTVGVAKSVIRSVLEKYAPKEDKQ